MELFLALDPALLPRLRAHPIVKSCKIGRARTSMGRTVSLLGGAAWRAEMTIDQSSGCRIGLRLIEGKPAPLLALLQDLADRLQVRPIPEIGPATEPVKTKLPPLPADLEPGEALRQIGRSGLAHFLANQECLIATGDPESIHQMRVALRRLRSAMGLFKSVLDDPLSQAVRADLRWMQKALGAARDHDVLLGETLPAVESGVGFDGLRRKIDEMRKAGRAAVLKEIQAPHFAKALLRLACWIEDAGEHGGEPIRAVTLAVVQKRYRKLRRRMADFRELDEERRHECRIEIKKLRYAAEFHAAMATDRKSQKFISALAALQEDLGRLNDIATAQILLRQIAEHSSPEIAWAAGRVVGWHQKSIADLLAQAWHHWLEFEELTPFWA